MGIDILEAVQPECMDLAFLKREFGRDISFWGGVGTQSILARLGCAGSVGRRRAEPWKSWPRAEAILPLRPTRLPPEVPWETVDAFHEAMQRYGAYPCPGSELAATGTRAAATLARHEKESVSTPRTYVAACGLQALAAREASPGVQRPGDRRHPARWGRWHGRGQRVGDQHPRGVFVGLEDDDRLARLDE